ncbi:Rv3654c family TadE-like protein, partial [Streptomyces noursei]|uniref:Rv3654c family TadE-like protein n=1 Tax=Streptomyces noursei TaxID=1971 RepID=UPI0035DAD2EA
MWTVVAAAALCAVFAALMAVGQAVAARHRAGAAADLAALAAADQALRGPAAACATARRVAVGQRTSVVRCALVGLIADVTVEAVDGPFTSRVRSRAGPGTGGPEAGVNGGPVAYGDPLPEARSGAPSGAPKRPAGSTSAGAAAVGWGRAPGRGCG